MHGFLQDLRYGWRTLLKSRAFAIAGALTLALGIGAATVMFAVLDAVLLRPLPYPNAERVLWITEAHQHHEELSVAMPNFHDWQEQNHSFTALAARKWPSFSMSGNGLPVQLQGMTPTHEYFGILGVRPIMGRDFTAADDQPGPARTV